MDNPSLCDLGFLYLLRSKLILELSLLSIECSHFTSMILPVLNASLFWSYEQYTGYVYHFQQQANLLSLTM